MMYKLDISDSDTVTDDCPLSGEEETVTVYFLSSSVNPDVKKLTSQYCAYAEKHNCPNCTLQGCPVSKPYFEK